MTTVVKKDCHKSLALSFGFPHQADSAKSKWNSLSEHAKRNHILFRELKKCCLLCFSQYLNSRAFRAHHKQCRFMFMKKKCNRYTLHLTRLSVAGQSSAQRENTQPLALQHCENSHPGSEACWWDRIYRETLSEPTHTAIVLWLEDLQLPPLNLSHIIIYPLQTQVPKTVPILFLFMLVTVFCFSLTLTLTHTNIHAHTMFPAVLNYTT